MTTNKTLSNFESNLNKIILNSLKACLEAPEDDNGDPDWSPYDDVIEHLSNTVKQHVRTLVANIESASPKVSASKSGKTNKSGGAKKKNTYTQWVRVASRIRKDEIPGDEEVTVGANFRNLNSLSAIKYTENKEELELEGKTMTVKELLNHLKNSMPDLKDLSLTAMCWGLMPSDFREELVAKLDE